jgi:hypothetical protein
MKSQGGSYDWDSTGRGGKGRMEITDVTPSSRVTMNLSRAIGLFVRSPCSDPESYGKARRCTGANGPLSYLSAASTRNGLGTIANRKALG